jgi:hypothetical protein
VCATNFESGKPSLVLSKFSRWLLDLSLQSLLPNGYCAINPGAVNNEQMQLTAAQTNLMQADIAQVATGLSLASSQMTALEAVIAQLGSASNSLFSKL